MRAFMSVACAALFAAALAHPAAGQARFGASAADPRDHLSCSGFLAEGAPAATLWQGYYAGRRTESLEPMLDRVSAGFCFASREACERWLYDMRSEYSLMTYRDECRRFGT